MACSEHTHMIRREAFALKKLPDHISSKRRSRSHFVSVQFLFLSAHVETRSNREFATTNPTAPAHPID